MLATKTPATPSSIVFPGYTHPVSKKLHFWHKFTYYTLHGWEKVVIVVLSLVALNELVKASIFIIADYQLLQNEFALYGGSSEKIREILSEAIGTMLSTLVNILMALRLTISQERLSRFIELLLATALIIWQSQIIEFLQQLNYTIFNLSGTF